MITQLTLKRILVKTRLLEWPIYILKKNYLYNFIRFGIWTKKYLPEVVYLETTNNCNATCFSCPRLKMDRPIGVMNWNLFEKIVGDLKKLKRLYFTMHLDGEPLLDPLLFERIEYIKKNLVGSKVHFNTNTSLLSEEIIKKILNSNLDSITFSIDGTTKETYEHIKTGMNFEQNIKNVENFFRIKKELKKTKPLTILQMVVNDKNKHQIEDFKRMWQDRADKIYIKAMLNFLVQGTSIKTKSLFKKQLRRCFQPITNLVIYWDGQLGLCCWDYNHLAKLGNANDNQLLETFNNSNYTQIRKTMLKMSCENTPPCNICSQIFGYDMNANYK